jgi:hypothetical protein
VGSTVQPCCSSAAFGASGSSCEERHERHWHSTECRKNLWLRCLQHDKIKMTIGEANTTLFKTLLFHSAGFVLV